MKGVKVNFIFFTDFNYAGRINLKEFLDGFSGQVGRNFLWRPEEKDEPSSKFCGSIPLNPYSSFLGCDLFHAVFEDL